MALEHLYDALANSSGVCVTSDNPAEYRRELQRIRSLHVANNPALAFIEIVASHTRPDVDTWLINRSIKDGQKEGEGAPGEGDNSPVQG